MFHSINDKFILWYRNVDNELKLLIIINYFVFVADSQSSRLGSADSNGNENQIIEVPEMTNTQKLMNLKQNPEVRHDFLSEFFR